MGGDYYLSSHSTTQNGNTRYQNIPDNLEIKEGLCIKCNT
jgi:hypothetical protein